MSESKIYCPYLGAWIPQQDASNEHIIPLSLGGHNDFSIPVDLQTNRTLGHSVDGPLANEFLLAQGRIEFNARGHSKKEPAFTFRKTRNIETGDPLQVVLGKKLRITNPKTKEELTGPTTFSTTIETRFHDLALRFVAKTFLSAGYFAYGELLINCVDHKSVRLAMKDPLDITAAEIPEIKANVFTPFDSRDEIGDSQANQMELQKLICNRFRGSCVVLAPGPSSLGVYVGLMRQYLGMINVSADTSGFPRTGIYDGGHVLAISEGRTLRCSYRKLLETIAPLAPQLIRNISLTK